MERVKIEPNGHILRVDEAGISCPHMDHSPCFIGCVGCKLSCNGTLLTITGSCVCKEKTFTVTEDSRTVK